VATLQGWKDVILVVRTCRSLKVTFSDVLSFFPLKTVEVKVDVDL